MAEGQQKTYEITAQPRTILGKQSQKLRRQGSVPGILYGHKVEPTPVAVDSKELDRVYHRAGNNSLVDLKVGDNGKVERVFIHNIQRDPVTHNLRHVDFMVVNLTEEITTTVPLVLTGDAPAVKSGDGTLLHLLDHLQIRALPTGIPQSFEVDVTGLDEVDKSMLVSDVQVPDGVQVLNAPDEMIVKIAALRAEPEEEVAATEAAEEEAEESGEAAAVADEEG